MAELCRPLKIALYVLSGLLLGVGFVYEVVWFLGLFGVALFVFAVKNTASLKAALIGGAIAWTVKSLCALSLFWSVYPIKWLEVSFGNFELPIIFVYWFTVASFLSLGGVLVAGAIWTLDQYKVSAARGALFFPVLWVVGEVVSAYSFSIWTFGPGATINSVYTLGYLGYLFGQHETLLLLAKVAGVYGLSALGALLGYGIWFVFTKLATRKAITLVVAFVLLLVVSRGHVASLVSEDSIKETVVAIIDTRFGDEWLLVENRELYKLTEVQAAVAAALTLNPDYILLPEDSRFTNAGLGIDRAYNLFRFQNSDQEVVLIDSARTALRDNVVTQRAYVYDGISKKGFITDKQYLVPQGEFMPYFYSVSLQILGLQNVATKLEERFIYVPGPEPSQAQFAAHLPGILFCFESADPRAVKRLLNERAVPFIAHPISHAWFHESELLWQQQDVMLKMQALWSGVPIVSAANMAKGALYTKEGKKILPTPKLSGESWDVSLVSW